MDPTAEEKRAFENFLNGFALFPAQLKIAKERICYIEAVILQTAFIDAMLRMALVLRDQLVNKHGDVDFNLLCQPDGTRNLSEREVYDRALEQAVVDDLLHQELQDLFRERNRIVHRLFISEIKYTDLIPVSHRLDKAIEQVHDIVWRLEREQIETGVGMTVAADDSTPEFTDDDWKEMFLKKL
ncbi:MAG: hypothetical protein IT202_06755 [Fimbriimonadaceae bacterium]|nr:hypothetical protein [Fimbriimonadaceae bacterium]MCC6352191.1 hypothetical protein [Fimbriimonadaceae bacterium]